MIAILVSAFYRAYRKRLFNWPRKAYSSKNSFVIHSGFSAPLLEGLRFPERSNAPIIGSIVLLLKLSRPAAVFWRVIFRWVYSIDSMVRRWLWPHVLNKIGKALPVIAKLYSLCPVLSVTRCFRILTSLLHVHPSSIFARRFVFSWHGGLCL